MGNFISKCGCGKSYDLSSWKKLHLCGIQRFPKFDDGGSPLKDLEMRNCSCGSTRCVPVDEIYRPSQFPPA